ncbi:MAG: 5-(carboxyamino)imidazole ribonucleotide synthase [Solirubrobacterales bacterium]
MSPGNAIAEGSVRVGMVGAGQLARMTQQAAIGLGVELTVLAESTTDPAVLAGARFEQGSPTSIEDLRKLASLVDVVTFDHEQVDPALLNELEAEGVNLAPGASAKLHAQDKLHARRALASHDFPIPDFAEASTIEEFESFAAANGWPVVAKAPRGGYDGRGVWMLEGRDQADELLATAPGTFLLEVMLEIELEIAVMVARSPSGEMVVYPVVETVQRDAMCREVHAPASIPAGSAEEAARIATDIAGLIGLVGVMAVELFVTPEGLLVNELALRPHNSGHYSIEGCVTSQFEQHLRAVLNLPLGETSLTAPSVVTVNVVGGGTEDGPESRLAAALTVPGAHVHLYGKKTRPGRKLGHVTVCGQDADATANAARAAASALEEGSS